MYYSYMSTLLDVVNSPTALSLLQKYGRFVDLYEREFASFGLDRVRLHRTSRIAWAMIQDLASAGMPSGRAEMHALTAVLSILIGARYSFHDAAPDRHDLSPELSHFIIPGYEAVQQRWLTALHLRRMMHRHRIGRGDYRNEITAMQNAVDICFSHEYIVSLDLKGNYAAMARHAWDS